MRVSGWHHSSMLYLAGNAFLATATDLPGGFADHRATGAWLSRLIDPAGLLGPTLRERGEQLLAGIDREHGTTRLDTWRHDADGFRALLRLLSDTRVSTSDSGIAALEFVTRFPEDAPSFAYNNLLYAYLAGGDLAAAKAFLPTALKHGAQSTNVWHNAACVAARTGDPEQALELARTAKQRGYRNMASMRADEDLRTLWDDPRFQALFDDD